MSAATFPAANPNYAARVLDSFGRQTGRESNKWALLRINVQARPPDQ